MRRTSAAVAIFLLLALAPTLLLAGNIYQIVVQHQGETKKYNVQFGGSERFDSWTAFDPETKRFVYLKFPRGEAGPKPAATIWDSRTGESSPLYQFEGARHPLPRIESLHQLKVCPFTGSKELKVEATIAID